MMKMPGWIVRNWGVLAAVVIDGIVAIVVLAVIWSQPLPKVKVTVVNEFYFELEIEVYVDDELMGSADLEIGESQTIGEWSISDGDHTVWVDRSEFVYGPIGFFTKSPDGHADALYEGHFSSSSEYEFVVTFGQAGSIIEW